VLVLPLVLMPALVLVQGLALAFLPPARLPLAPASGPAPRRPGREPRRQGPVGARREQEPMLSPPRRRRRQKPLRLPQRRQRLQQAPAL